ncbi:hypothetical protein EVAR_38533_1 [Eumeta japonica]|uniref:Uncharacterized protein n=1 Tax=Eumeta variegata TaxID=151549 RepID=A0A4C1WAZ2_EUMVA|nr:hypothetical protein EVAR_38533_1 [Eumeta japonica]
MSAAILKGAPCKHRITRRVSEPSTGPHRRHHARKQTTTGDVRDTYGGECANTRREMDDVARVVRSLDNVGMSIPTARTRVFCGQEKCQLIR